MFRRLEHLWMRRLLRRAAIDLKRHRPGGVMSLAGTRSDPARPRRAG